MIQLYIIICAFAVSLMAAVTLVPWMQRLTKKAGVVIAPIMGISMSVAFMLFLSEGILENSLKLSSLLMGIGVALAYLLGIMNDYLPSMRWVTGCLALFTCLAFPLCGLYVNNLYGLLGIYDIPYYVGFVLTAAITYLWTAGRRESGETALDIMTLMLFGGVFFSLGYWTYSVMAASLAGALIGFLYFKHYGDSITGTKAVMGNTGELTVNFCTLYLMLKYAMDNPRVMSSHDDGLLLPLMVLAAYLIIPIVMRIYMSRRHKHNTQTAAPCVDYKGEEGLVSIIMPTWNSERYVSESIESIQAQTYPHWELVICDDCSTDGTMEILHRYEAEDPRIRVYSTEKNSGAGVARNNSIMQARGQYMAFCDSDDTWTRQKLEKQITFMRAHEVAICFSPYYTQDGEGETLGYVSAPRRTTLFEMMCDNKIGFLTCVYDTRTLGKHAMPRQRKRQDHAMLLHLLRKAHAAYSVREPLAYYRLHEGNMSRSKLGLIKYNAHTYTEVFGWTPVVSYAFLFTIFMPSYIYKKAKNLMINIVRSA